MAIEFNCPHCSGVLRASERDAGRMLACRHCAGEVVVPAPPPRALEFLCPACSATIRVPQSAIGARGKCPACQANVLVPDPGERTIASESALPSASFEPRPIEADEGLSALTRRARRRRSRAPLLVPLILIALFVVGGLIYWLKPEPPLVGELKGQLVQETELGPFLISRSLSELPDGEFAAIVDSLEAQPLRARTQLLRVEFQGLSKGIGVAIHTGDDTTFVRVDPPGDRRLRRFIDQHVDEFDERRRSTLVQTLPDFLKALDRRRKDGASVDGLLEFRNQVGLAASVRGLGWVVMAHHQGVLYPCVHEDREGGLFFALPKGIREFALIGRKPTTPREPILFPGEYQIHVSEVAKSPKRGPSSHVPKAVPNRTPVEDESSEAEPE